MKKSRVKRPNKLRKEKRDSFFSEKDVKSQERSAHDSFFQPKLEISDPSDAFEVEAEAMADHVIQQENKQSPGAAFGSQGIQRQAEEEEPAARRIQRQAEEEEPAAKRIQRQAEEEEPAAKRIQRQAEEEEPAAKRIQRQAEEEEPAAKRIQRQAEEEEPAAKRIQRQAEEEEPAAKRIQRKAEEEEPAAKRIQGQAEEEEPAAKRIQRQAEEEEPAAKQIQRKSESANSSAVQVPQSANKETVARAKSGGSSQSRQDNGNAMDSIEARIKETKGEGLPLPEDIKIAMESEFNTDFSNVRIHTDETAIELAASLNAQAFTHGYDIYFNTGKYNPYSKEGKHLLAHELTHVVQQKG